jgi:hypothetical protein
MPSSADDFRQRARKEVELPSGLTVRIRYCQQLHFIGAYELPMRLRSRNGTEEVEETEENQREGMKYFSALADAAIIHGAIAPRFAPRGAPEQAELVALEDLETEDYYELARAILRHSGLAPEVASSIEAFQQNLLSSRRSADGGTLQSITLSDTPGDASGVLPESSLDGAPGGNGTPTEVLSSSGQAGE